MGPNETFGYTYIYIWLFFSRERGAKGRGMKRRTSQLKQEANEREPKNDTAKVE